MPKKLLPNTGGEGYISSVDVLPVVTPLVRVGMTRCHKPRGR